MNFKFLTTLLAVIAFAANPDWVINSAWSAQGGSEGVAMPIPQVSYITVAVAQLTTEERLPGRTHAQRVAEVRPQVTGIVTQRLFTEGALVEQGDALYQIDDAIYQAEKARAEALLEAARVNLDVASIRAERIAELRKSNAVSQQDSDDVRLARAQAQAAVKTAEADLLRATINLDYTRVYAPISGQISQSLVTEGALVTSNQSQALAVITQLDPIFVDVMQSSADHMALRQQLDSSSEIAVELDIGNGVQYAQSGTLQFSSVFVNESTGSIQLRALFPNPDHKLLPGMFVHARLQLEGERGILIPQQTTQRDSNGKLSVWKLEADNTVRQVQVTEARAVGNQWLLRYGLQAGDRIVTKGFQKITAGMTVSPIADQSVNAAKFAFVSSTD